MWELQEHALKLVESIKIGQKDEKKSKLFYRGELRAKHGFQEAEDLLVLLCFHLCDYLFTFRHIIVVVIVHVIVILNRTSSRKASSSVLWTKMVTRHS